MEGGAGRAVAEASGRRMGAARRPVAGAILSLDPGHPLWPLARSVVDAVPGTFRSSRARAIDSYVSFVAGRSVDPLAASVDDVRDWLGGFGTGGARSSRLTPVRALYRAAFDAGLIPRDPTAGIHYNRDTIRPERSLSDDDVCRVVGAVRRDFGDPIRSLAARRDLVMVAILLTHGLSLPTLTGLRWGDAVLGTSDSTLAAAELPEPVRLTPAAAGTLRDLLTAFATYGVEVVPEDALLAALGNRDRFAWLADDRPLLTPLTVAGLSQALHGRFLQAGLTIKYPSGLSYSSASWLLRGSPAEVEAALRLDLGSGSGRRVAMRQQGRPLPSHTPVEPSTHEVPDAA